MRDSVDSWKMDKASFSVIAISDVSEDKQYWVSRQPAERLAAMEFMRALNYGYDAATTRLQRILTVAPLGED